MIDIPQAFWLALIQGVTEFLPISSSGHLILLPYFLNWPDQGLAFDVAVHVGTLSAILFYLREDIKKIAIDLIWLVMRKKKEEGSQLGLLILLATFPVVITVLAFDTDVWTRMRHPVVIGVTTAGFALVLLISDIFGSKKRTIQDLGWLDALVIGVAQAIALIPGTSRAGITMTAALMVGVDRRSSAKFSFLLSIPVIFAAGIQQSALLIENVATIDWQVFAIGLLVSAISAWLVIKIFIRWLTRIGMLPFVVYRVILGVFILTWIY
tara:strand:+ start:407 stop:1207 length:801 start_codon:yes stop_codon:yes gene_type:complete